LRQLHGYAASVEEVGAVANVGQMSVSSTICLRSSIVRYRLPPRVSMCQLTSCSWRMPLRPCYRQMAKTGRLQCSISAASFLQNWLGQRWMFPPKKALGCTWRTISVTPRKSGYGHRTRTRSPALNISYPLGRHLRGRIVKIGQPTVVLTSIA